MRKKLIQEIETIIPYLSEEMIVDAFETEMAFDGYFIDSSEAVSDWESGKHWLQWRLDCSVGGLANDELQEALDFWKELL
jgi:hypothetical protein